MARITILPECSLGEPMDLGGIYANMIPVLPLKDNTAYKMLWMENSAKETIFTCVAHRTTFNGIDTVGFGNFALMGMGEDTGEPFLVAVAPAVAEAFIIVSNPESSHTVAIYQELTDAEVVMEEQTLTGFEDIGENLHILVLQNQPFSFAEGQLYRVFWDGEEHISKAIPYEENGITATVLGNLSLAGLGNDTGEPFVMQVQHAVGIAAILAISGGATNHRAAIFDYVPPGETLLELQIIPGFAWTPEYSAYCFNMPQAPFVLEAGKHYQIIWDSRVYQCTAYENNALGYTMVCIGNGTAIGGQSAGEPFLLTYTVSNGWMSVFSEEAKTYHTAAVFQMTEGGGDPDDGPGEEPDVTAGILLKDYAGEDIVYENVDTVMFDSANGTTAIFSRGEVMTGVEIAPDFSKGDMQVNAPSGKLIKSGVVKKPETLVPENIAAGVTIAGVEGKLKQEGENLTVDVDFSDGNMTVMPPNDKLLSSVTINKPEMLIPENVAEGVEIAGVIGTLAGGGGGGKIVAKTGSYTATSSTGVHTINHGLGAVPDFIRIYSNKFSAGCFSVIVGKSNGLAALAGTDAQHIRNYTATGFIGMSAATGVDEASAGMGQIYGANATSFKVGGSLIKHISGAIYDWEAIAGIVPR